MPTLVDGCSLRLVDDCRRLLDLQKCHNHDDQSGRFMSLDPHQPSYMNPQSLSGYIYALDNPFRYTDPTGALPQNELFTPKAKKEQQQQDEEDRIDREKYEKLREVINRMLDDSGVSGVGTFTYEFKTVSRGAIETTYISINGLECSITSTGKSVTTLESTAIVTSAGFQIASTDTTYSIGGTSTITTITTWEATTSVTTVSTTTNEETTATTTWTGQGWNPSMGPGPQGEVPGCFVAGVDAAVGFGGMAQYGMYDKNTLDFLARFMGWCFG